MLNLKKSCKKLTTQLATGFFPETPFGGISQGMAGSGKNSSGQKIRRNFLTLFSPQFLARNYNDIFLLARVRNLLNLARNWYILARICIFWPGKTGPDEEKFGVTPRQCVSAGNFFEFFLANPLARLELNFLLLGSCTATNIAKPPKLTTLSSKSLQTCSQ